MWETQVRSLGREDPLEKEMATHSSNPLQNPMEGGAWWATVHGVTKSRTRLSNFTSLHCIPSTLPGLKDIKVNGRDTVSTFLQLTI